MGNCLVLEHKDMIESGDEKRLKCQSPIKAHRTLSKYHGLVSRPVERHQGQLSYINRSKKMQANESGAVRIKLVISKQELKEILKKEGLTMEDMMSQIQREKRSSHESEQIWKPALESISEVDHLY